MKYSAFVFLFLCSQCFSASLAADSAKAHQDSIEADYQDSITEWQITEAYKIAHQDSVTACQDSIKAYRDSIKIKRGLLIRKYKNINTVNNILGRHIRIGMTKEMVIDSWGEPEQKKRDVGSWGVHEQWIYGSTYLYFENGILTSWQD